MGKAKRGRALTKGQRKEGLPKGPASGKDPHQTQSHYLLTELRSSAASRKEAAVVALAQLLSQGDANEGATLAIGPYRKLVGKLLDEGVIGLLIERMFDTASMVRLHAAGSMRNMAAIGDSGIAQKMVQDDVMTALLGLLDKVEEEQQGEELAVQALETMTSLCESSDEAVKAVTKRCPQSLESLFRTLHHATSTQKEQLLISAAQTVHTVTDHNYPFVEQICRHSDALPFLTSLVDPPSPPPPSSTDSTMPPLARLHLAGALGNMYHSLKRANFSDPKGAPFPSQPDPQRMVRQVVDVVGTHLTFQDAQQALTTALSSMSTALQSIAVGRGEEGEEEEEEEEARMDTGEEGQEPEEEEEGVMAVGEGGAAASSSSKLSRREARQLRKQQREAREEAEGLCARLTSEWVEALTPKRLALEVLANLSMASADDDDEEENDDEELALGSDDEEEAMERMAREGQGKGAEGEERGGAYDDLLQGQLRSSGVLPRLITMLKDLCVCFLSLGTTTTTGQGGKKEGAGHPPPPPVAADMMMMNTLLPMEVIRGVLDLRQRAATALGNIIAEYPDTQLAAEAGALWSEFRALCQLGLQEESAVQRPWYRRGEEPWMGVLTGVMTSFVRRAPHMADREDLSMLALLLSTSVYYEVRVNAAAMLGLSGSGRQQQDGQAAQDALVVDVGRALGDAMVRESHVMVTAEVLNAVMDIFADDDLHPIFVQLGLLGPLQRLLPQFRAKCKTEEASRHGREAAAHAKEVALNTSRFIKYKQAAMK